MQSCPNCNSKSEGDIVVSNKPPITGCAWDRVQRGWIGSFFATIKQSLVHPVTFFSEVAEGNGKLRPWLFAFILTFTILELIAIFRMGMMIVDISGNNLEVTSPMQYKIFPITVLLQGFPVVPMVFFSAILSPIVTISIVFPIAGVYHLCLKLIGAASANFQTTFRVVCYLFVSQLFHFIPFVGGILSIIVYFALAIVGIKEVHKTSYVRSVLVIFLPIIVCSVIIFYLVT